MTAAATAQSESLPADLQWKDATEIELRIDFPGQGYRAHWQLFRCDCGDLLVRSELDEPGEAARGDILLVGNRAVLTRGFGARAAELASVDGPALMMQLALRLLDRAEPAGPGSVVDRRDVQVEDAVNYINLDSGAAVGSFPAPWSVTGALWPAAERVRRFDLEFTFSTTGVGGAQVDQARMRLAGSVDFTGPEFPLHPESALRNWKLQWRDPDDPLARAESSPETLGQLRNLLRAGPSQ